jgi:hypothetical protein
VPDSEDPSLFNIHYQQDLGYKLFSPSRIFFHLKPKPLCQNWKNYSNLKLKLALRQFFVYATAPKCSKPKIKDRHDKVKLVRVELVKEAGYSGVLVELSFAATGARADLSQRRGDVFFRDESKLVHIHYVTDDVFVHPLSPAYIDHDERVDHSHALGEAVKKEKQYDSALTMMRSAGACRAGPCWPPEGDLSRRLVRARG